MAHLGEKLKSYRLQKGMNQPEMAEYVGIAYRTYQDIEKTGKAKKVEVLDKILRKTGIDTQVPASSDNGNHTPTILETLMARLASLTETQNRILERQEKGLLEKVDKMDVNLNTIAALAEKIDYELESGRATVLRALSRLEKKPVNELVNEADNLKTELIQARDEIYRKYENKQSSQARK
jgi:transcriptional regulator with XRE-family HTH domain